MSGLEQPDSCKYSVALAFGKPLVGLVIGRYEIIFCSMVTGHVCNRLLWTERLPS